MVIPFFPNFKLTPPDDFINMVNNGEMWGGLVIPESYSSTIFTSSTNRTELELIKKKSIEYYNPIHYPIEYHFDEGRNYNMHSVLNKTIATLITKLSLSIPAAFVGAIPSPYNEMIDPYFISYPLNLKCNFFNLKKIN